MPLKPKPIERLYWSISEVAEQLGVNASVLRFWEKEFGHLRPKRTGKGDRLYTKDDIAKVQEIHHLLKEKGFTIDGAKAHLRSRDRPQEAADELLQRLERVKAKLLAMRAELGDAPEA